MSQPLLIIVTGPPGAGKTTLGRRLASDLKLPFLHKDGIKERLHDGLGTADLEASRRLGRLSFDLLYDMAGVMLTAGVSLVIEANFAREYASLPIQTLCRTHGAQAIQVVCHAPVSTLRERMLSRRENGERHAAHLDSQALAGIETDSAPFTAAFTTLDIDGETISLDTSDFTLIDYDSLLARLRLKLARDPAARGLSPSRETA